MSAPLYSLEEALERSVIATLQGVTALSGVAIVAADRSEEIQMPFVAVRAERQDEVVRGMQTYNATLSATLTTSADETEEDGGGEAFLAEWKALTDALAAGNFVSSVNSSELVHVWGVEQQPVSYENTERAFSRRASLRVWCNEAYSTPAP